MFYLIVNEAKMVSKRSSFFSLTFITVELSLTAVSFYRQPPIFFKKKLNTTADACCI